MELVGGKRRSDTRTRTNEGVGSSVAPAEGLQLPEEFSSHHVGFDNEGWYRKMEIPVDIIGFSQRKVSPVMSDGTLMVEAVADLLLGNTTPQSYTLTKVRSNPSVPPDLFAVACGNRRLCVLKTYQAVSRTIASQHSEVGLRGLRALGANAACGVLLLEELRTSVLVRRPQRR